MLKLAKEKGHVNIVDCLKEAMRPDGSMGGKPVVTQNDAARGMSIRKRTMSLSAGRFRFFSRRAADAECNPDNGASSGRLTF
jgi:hypothetical protein